MKERKVDEETAKKDSDMKLKDIFTVIGKNDQLRYAIIAIILYYTGSGVLVAGGLNYFYFSFGYAEGGSYQFIFTVVFALATFLGQFLYPILKNKVKWNVLIVLVNKNVLVYTEITRKNKYILFLCRFPYFI